MDFTGIQGQKGSNMLAIQLAKKIAVWVGQNWDQESGFLTPAPQVTVDAVGLLDYIAEITGISKETIGEWTRGE